MHSTVLYRNINVHILERNTECNECGKAVHISVVSKCTKTHILERNLIIVINVIKPLYAVEDLTTIEEHILYRNPTNLAYVVKPLYVLSVFKIMRK